MKTVKLEKKNYNTTDLNPVNTFERHVFHRDQFAHYLRWTHILKETRIGEKICDFGCGNGNLLEVLYRNRFKQAKYIGIDIRDCAKPDLKKLEWAEFLVEDLVNPQNNVDFNTIKADRVCSFEVIEHVGKQNGYNYLINMRKCGHDTAKFYISTPNFDEKVGAAGNHTYDSGDGRGKVSQEFKHEELNDLIVRAGFKIINKFGTFASVRDYKPLMNEWQLQMFDSIKDYYDANLVSNLMAPFFPEQSRNCMWVLEKDLSINPEIEKTYKVIETKETNLKIDKVEPIEDPLSSLIKLKSLLESELITQEEFNSKKIEILSRL
jgi:2-polyprenyl-3-methyl-5-hydroxy-6-metoxy-1,4-benzoquinol methylase